MIDCQHPNCCGVIVQGYLVCINDDCGLCAPAVPSISHHTDSRRHTGETEGGEG